MTMMRNHGVTIASNHDVTWRIVTFWFTTRGRVPLRIDQCIAMEHHGRVVRPCSAAMVNVFLGKKTSKEQWKT